jgi:hypothetical protein
MRYTWSGLRARLGRIALTGAVLLALCGGAAGCSAAGSDPGSSKAVPQKRMPRS